MCRQDDRIRELKAQHSPHQDEIAEAVCELAICLAQALHEIDPAAAARMNFAAGKSYNRLLRDERLLAADIMYRFGRSLMDRQLFPGSEDAVLNGDMTG